MKKLKKKAAINMINAGMLSFIAFVLVVILVIVLISVTKSTTLVCNTDDCGNCTVTYDGGTCFLCEGNGTTLFNYNSTSGLCHESTNINNSRGASDYGGAAYNGTKNLQEAAALPPQFAQIIVIAVIIIGILALLATAALVGYQKLKR